MTQRDESDSAAVEAVLELPDWSPAPLGPCGARASRRRRVAEAIVARVRESDGKPGPQQLGPPPVPFGGAFMWQQITWPLH